VAKDMVRAALIGLVWLMVSTSAVSEPLELNPSPDLTPLQVVEFQLDALKHNDEPTIDAGIERSFRFASPANRLATGPLSHFSAIVHSPTYSALLRSQASEVRGVVVEGEQAKVYVIVTSATGSKLDFLFLLSRQHQADYRDCWMTDSVMKLPSEQNENQIAI
jgi:hypothetical protein